MTSKRALTGLTRHLGATTMDPGAGRAEVRGVVAGDAGTYTCTATSRRGQTARAEAEVAVIGR